LNRFAPAEDAQANAIENTAAALDQITVNVANSSKRADEARKVAVLANESAAQSGKVVANAVDAMRKIEQSSNEISNIIGVIDEIAFQTNLLALNAGVVLHIIVRLPGNSFNKIARHLI
jgi:methyl-accepting chemotaxis protein